jgi:hypothetical protein
MDRIKNRSPRGGGHVMQRTALQDHNTVFSDGLDGPDDILAVDSADIPDINREAITRFIAELHSRGAPFAASGELVLSYQDARFAGDKASFRHARYAIGPQHAARMVEDIIALAANPHTNIYIEQRVVRNGTNGRGRKADTLAVLALVDDDDADAGKGTTKLPVQPTEVIQTSAKNRQLRYQFAEPLSLEIADRIGEKLRQVSRSDGCTGTVTQPFRVPGTLNWPTKRKMAERGRSAIPFMVKNVGGTGTAIDAGDFEEILDSALPERVDARAEAGSGKRDGDNAAGRQCRPSFAHLSHKQTNGLQYSGENIDRSQMWHSICWRLFRKGFSVDAVAEFLQGCCEQYTQGIAAKYSDRIKQEVQRSYEKFAAEGSTTGFSAGRPNGPAYPRVSDGKIKEKSPANVKAFLDWRGAHPFRDVFAGETYIEMDDKCRRFDDAVLRELWLLNSDFGHTPTKNYFEDVVENLARLDQRHPVIIYLDSLTLDGRSRLDTWLTDYFGADDTPLTRALGRKTLIAAVRRLRQPGVKFDQMLVLEGSQGAGKSRALRALAGDSWFTDNLEIGADTKRIIENTAGKWIVEVAELSGMNRRDVEHVKAMLSRQTDDCRLAYDRKTTKAPRQFIMIGTTNASAYLLDDTGGRRFWPVKVADVIDCDGLARDRDQLWAEAVAAEAKGEALFLPEELRPQAKEAQASRQISHPWREKLETLLDGREGIIVKDHLYAALDIETGRLNKTVAGEIANHLTPLGWTATRLRHPDPKLGRVHVFRRGQGESWLEVVVERDPNRPDNRRAYIKTADRAFAGEHDPFNRRAAGGAT